jgi:hypothetical protein
MDNRHRINPAFALLSLLFLFGCAETTRPGDTSSKPIDIVDGRPHEVASTDISFEGDGLTLKGTMDRPRGIDDPVPGVVIIHGSGPSSRVGTAPGQLGYTFPSDIDVYKDLGQGLAAKGYAVLRYDKRTCGPFNNCNDNGYPAPSGESSVDRFYTDALDAVDALAARQDVDSDEIYVIGHSQGAKMAVKAAADRPEVVAGSVSLSGTPAPIDELYRYQYEYLLRAYQDSGLSEEEARSQLSSLLSTVENLEALAEGSFEGDTIDGLGVAFWQSWVDLHGDVTEAVPRIDQPLLSLSGDQDTNVPPRYARRWEPLFEQGTPRLEHAVDVQSCITHPLSCFTPPDSGPLSDDDFGTEVDPKVIERLTDYLDRVHQNPPR